MVTKKDYFEPLISVVVFQTEDVITGSGAGGETVTFNGTDNLGEWAQGWGGK